MNNLLIVESPNKVKSIAKYLGSEWDVAASVGHIRDLPEKEIAIVPPDFKPKYEVTADKRDVVNRLKKMSANAKAVYLATDPDREGEAISWHLQQALGLKDPHRVTFNEITQKAVQEAVRHPRKIDVKLVAAQETRRSLDRLVGYTVSPRISDLAGERLSAGRVQSPALRMIVERERAIRAFKSRGHFGVLMHFDGAWCAEWQFASLLPKDGDKLWTDKSFAERVAKLKALRVLDVTEGQSKSAPPAPFITSTIQQAGSAALGFSPKKTMEVAQSLFAAGLITYMRTDNPNLSDEAIDTVRKLATVKKLPLPEIPRKWKAKPGAQTAHPGIHPTHFENEEAGSTTDERKLYKLIWLRAVACQLADAVFDVRVAKLESVDQMDGRTMQFEGRGRKLRFAGWKVLTEKDSASEEEDQADNPVPQLAVGAVLHVEKGEVQEKKTQPPARYTEASLVKDLENKEIGRPSTYASIIGNIHSRGYYTIEKKKIHGTPLGERTFGVMEGQFSFLEFSYTKEMEEQLDAIAHGKQSYLNVVKRVYDDLNRELSNLKAPDGVTVHACPECGKPLRRIKGGQGPFWGCSGYPDCKKSFEHNAKADAPVLNGVKKASDPKVTGPKCPDCGKQTFQRMAKTGPNAGNPFWGCSGYPACKGTVKVGEDTAGQDKADVATDDADKALLDML